MIHIYQTIIKYHKNIIYKYKFKAKPKSFFYKDS